MPCLWGVWPYILSWKNKAVFFMGFITSSRKQIENYANISVMSNYSHTLDSYRMAQNDHQIKAANETEKVNE